MSEHVVIVGAGLGGLSAAIHLASAGRRVTVLEKNGTIGGKMNEVREAGFRWDTGPTVITLRHILADLFVVANRHIEDYVTLVPIDPLTRYVYPDGTILDINSSLARTVTNIEALDEQDVAGYLRFMAYAARMYRITAPVALYGDPPSLRSMLGIPLQDMMRVDLLRTMYGAIRAHVRSTYLRTLFSRFATYLGASPYSARAYLIVISHVELTAGLWYPKGGTVQIARAYQRLAEELGVEVRTGVRVTQILVENGTAQGVQTADGSTVHGDAVIADVDATTVYYNLIPSLRGSKRLKRWITKPFSCSGFVMLLGIDKQHPQLMHHNILFSDDYATEFDAIFRRGIPLKDPTVYIAITSKTDPGHAPPSSENWFVMTNVPPLGPGWNWEQDLDRYRSLVLERLARFGFDVRGHIQTERMITPVDIERLTGAWRGALYGHSFNPPFAPFLRPHNRCPDVRSLYFAGGTTHPGGGVPLVTLSGKTAARMAIRDGIS